jgi:hypothetical protein
VVRGSRQAFPFLLLKASATVPLPPLTKQKSHAPLQEHGVSKVLFQFNYLTKVLRRVSSHPPGCIVLPFFVRIYASRVYLGDQRLAETGFYSF